ncbi:MAG: hypothetical protein H6Q68_2075 [Firmicutes bacterium]|nr:hypothetical protein [Bacillota bacterium]
MFTDFKQTRMSFHSELYNLIPEDKLPDSSQLSRFRSHRLGASQVDDVLKIIVR